MYRLLIIEDDNGIADAIKVQAELWDLQVHCIENFRSVMAEFAEFDPHIILLDIALPFFNGYHWCSEIRKVSKVPIVFISSASDNMNMVMAMNMGADDFIAKPFDQSVLMAKLQALLRRTYDFSTWYSGDTCLGLASEQCDFTTFTEFEVPANADSFRMAVAAVYGGKTWRSSG